MSSTTPSQDSALPPPAPPPVTLPAGVVDLAALQAGGFPGFPPNVDGAQIMQILKALPQFKGVNLGQHKEDGTPANQQDAAQALSNLATYQQAQAVAAAVGAPFRVSDPGPSSHPHGPPPANTFPHPILGQAPMTAGGGTGSGGEEDDEGDGDYMDKSPLADGSRKPGSRRGRGGAAMGSEEWTRQRKDNHKEVERRRRGNINEGINELGRIVPSGSGEKAKGAILARAVQYIHHLKENEARNIEKWTLEKLLMDQAMGDLQVQLDEIRRMWEEERLGRQRAEAELETLRGKSGTTSTAEKRASPEGDKETGDNKKARTDS
ncbi:BHLH domain-containing protein [Mycena indigotica]|uniref:BHLH domain-containing protein n=1 Tax=Mycena indigotica TaxID=2126181 RepID=A0A8H6W0Q3_9AGAR|nr:BHLH domain-containing protein [Mycena indigotica]KAF7297318.1 BHLH domain-containing protein [Mycena indigotica]